MKKLSLLFLIPALGAMLLTGCKKNKPSGESSEESSSISSIIIDPTLDVTINFYKDFNYTHYKVRYYQTTVKNGSLITDVPPTPEAPSEDFPVFKGWSLKEITDDYEHDIWNFATDKVAVDSNSPTLSFYGIWAAE